MILKSDRRIKIKFNKQILVNNKGEKHKSQKEQTADRKVF